MAAVGHDSGPRSKRSLTSSVCVKRVTFSPAPHINTLLNPDMKSSGISVGMRHKTSSSSSSTSSIAQSPPVEQKRRRKTRLIKHLEHEGTGSGSSRPLLDKPPRKKKIKRVYPINTSRNANGEEPDGGHQLPSECPDHFGVKSYLHHFYENVAVTNPDMYEELQGGNHHQSSSGFGRSVYRYIMDPPKKMKCRSLWWKLAVWSGVFILVIGVIVILVGYLLPRRQVVVAGFSDSLEVVDRAALRYNSKLDTCKLSGLIIFCVGGAIVAVALLIPSFFYNYCDEDWSSGGLEPPFKVRADSLEDDDEMDEEDDDDVDDQLPPVLSPTEKKVPVTEELMRIQPEWGGGGEVVGGGGSVGSKEALITTGSISPPTLIR